MINVTEVHIPHTAEELVLEVLRSGNLAQGPMVRRLEEGFEHLCHVGHAVASSNGTTALELAIEASGVLPGDEVVTSPFTFVATVNAALAAGASVRFVDIDLETYCMSPDALAAALTPSTRAVIPVHLYGHPADLGRIAPLTADYGATLIEDAAQAHGAAIDAKPVGSFGIGCFSLYATKNMTTGEGGMVTTDDDQVVDRLRVLRNQGMRARYQYEMVGHNHRMTDLAAAVGVAELAELDAWTERRRLLNAAALCAGLDGVEGLHLPVEQPGHRHVYHQFTVRIDDSARITRDEFVEQLNANGVGCGIYYPRAAYDYECYRSHPRVVIDSMPVAELAAAQVVSLPVHPFLGESDIDRVVSVIRQVLAPAG